jgi:hypothetical protein
MLLKRVWITLPSHAAEYTRDHLVCQNNGIRFDIQRTMRRRG